MSPSCRECNFWSSFQDGYQGFCLRNPPVPMRSTPNRDGETEIESYWPTTNGIDWCGEFRPDVSKGDE